MREQRERSVSRATILGRMRANWRGSSLSRAAKPILAASATDVAAVLREYFQARLGIGQLAFTEEPVAFTDGWETYTYHFQLQNSVPLAADFAQPLAARIYCCPQALPRARREFLVQRHLYALNYPVAQPLFLEEDCTYLGGPFMVMARLCGPTLLQAALRQPWRPFRPPVQMAALQARLHQLPTSGFPGPPGCFLRRRLDEMAAAIEDYHLRDLRPGFDWLLVHRPEPPQRPSILHLDFHPLNLVLDRNRSLVVLDWNEADLGDRHADVGTTVMLMDCLPPIQVTRLERWMLRMGRQFFLPLYLYAYRWHLPLEANRLAYYRALAAFRRLCNYGRWLQDGPQISGNKPSMLGLITQDHRHQLECYFREWTGVGIRL